MKLELLKSVRVLIDPTSRVSYASYYVKGLYEVFGKRNVRFSAKPFRDLNRKADPFAFNHYFAFTVARLDKHTKFVVDFCDPHDINATAYDWCDVYAKINYPVAQDPDFPKLRLIPPGFGINIWNLPQTIAHGLRNYFSDASRCPVPAKTLLRDYWQQYRRRPLGDYLRTDVGVTENYVFMAGTLWNPRDNATRTNATRLNFVRECMAQSEIEFEGGLYAQKSHPEFGEHEKFLFQKPYSPAAYLKKTRESMLVFNTPAVHDCHGWKLPEFLAMGKAIISTPFVNLLPEPLTHGKNIFFIAREQELSQTISLLKNNPEQRNALGKNARAYFLEHLSPKVVIKSLL